MLFTFTLCVWQQKCVCVCECVFVFCSVKIVAIMLFLHWWPAFICRLFSMLHRKKVNAVQKGPQTQQWCKNKHVKQQKKTPQEKIAAIAETRQELKPTNPLNRCKRKIVHRGKEAKAPNPKKGRKAATSLWASVIRDKHKHIKVSNIIKDCSQVFKRHKGWRQLPLCSPQQQLTFTRVSHSSFRAVSAP